MTALAVPSQPPPYRMYGAARELWRCRDTEVSIEGPADTGKTRAVLTKLDAILNKYAGARVLGIRLTREDMTETVLVTYEERVLPRYSPIKLGAQRRTRQSYRYPNGSEFVIGGLDKPGKVLSGEYDVIAVFQAEQVTLEAYEHLLTRLRAGNVPYQQIICDCNPSFPGHWLNKRPEQKDPKTGKALMTRLLSRHADNPSLTPERLDKLDRLTGVRRARLRDGKWVGSEGIVYDCWDRAVHVRVREGPWARVIVGVDDGYSNPFCALRVCIDGDGRAHVEREDHGARVAESARVNRIADLGRDDAEAFVVDPAAASLRGAMTAAGLPTMEAENAVGDGINKVADRLVVETDGWPRLTVDPSCSYLIEQMESYEWLPDKPKDTPRKENDHGPDALRYAVMHVDGGPVVAAAWSSGRSEREGEPVPTFDELRADEEFGFGGD